LTSLQPIQTSSVINKVRSYHDRNEPHHFLDHRTQKVQHGAKLNRSTKLNQQYRELETAKIPPHFFIRKGTRVLLHASGYSKFSVNIPQVFPFSRRALFKLPTMTKTAGCLVWINGFPGSGKRAVAKEIARLCEGALIIENHHLTDPVDKVFQRDYPYYQLVRYNYRQAILKKYVHGKDYLSRDVVFTGTQSHCRVSLTCLSLTIRPTDVQSADDAGSRVALEYQEAAERSGRQFVPVYLTCERDTKLQRIASADHLESGTTKPADAALEQLHDNCDMFRFEDIPGLAVDSTIMAPHGVAKRILEFAREQTALSHGTP
jgi:hypothetical protein